MAVIGYPAEGISLQASETFWREQSICIQEKHFVSVRKIM
jgi:hypothetical protein